MAQRAPAGLLLLAILAIASPAPAQDAGAGVVRRGHITENLYLAGGRVDVLAEVDGDVVAAGGSVTIGRLVRGDVLAAGGAVDVAGQVTDDVRAAGGVVTVDGPVGGDVVAAGGRVHLPAGTAVAGRAWLAGGEVVVGGDVTKGLRVAAGTVRLGGHVQGDVDVAAQRIEVLPTARIDGRLTYWSPGEARIDPAARIGAIARRAPPGRAVASRLVAIVVAVVRVMWLLALVAVGVLLLLLVPGPVTRIARTIGSDPGTSLGLGLVVLVALPVTALAFAVTIVGIPLALLLLAVGAVSLPFAYLVCALFLGDLVARAARADPEPTVGARIVALVLALVGLTLLGLVPIAGWLTTLLAVASGLGAIVLRARRAWAGTRSPA